MEERDPVRRRESLQEGAARVEPAGMVETLAEIDRMKNLAGRKEVYQALLESWIQRDMNGIGVWFGMEGSDPESVLRIEARELLLETLNSCDPESAWAWMQATLSTSGLDWLKEPFFRQWGEEDPQAACARLYQLEDVSLLGEVAAQWGKSDVGSAVNWVKSLPDGPLKSQAMLEVSYLWTESAPIEAASYAAQQNNAGLFRAVAGKWASQSPQDAADWVAAQPPGELREEALAHLSQIWAQTDPSAAAAYAANMPEGSTRNLSIVTVATTWAYADPGQSAQWVSQLPEDNAREQALAHVVNAWAGARLEEAGQWILSLPDVGSTDFAVSAYSNALMEAHPDLAMEWADSISNESLRHAQMEKVRRAKMSKNTALLH